MHLYTILDVLPPVHIFFVIYIYIMHTILFSARLENDTETTDIDER